MALKHDCLRKGNFVIDLHTGASNVVRFTLESWIKRIVFAHGPYLCMKDMAASLLDSRVIAEYHETGTAAGKMARVYSCAARLAG